MKTITKNVQEQIEMVALLEAQRRQLSLEVNILLWQLNQVEGELQRQELVLDGMKNVVGQHEN